VIEYDTVVFFYKWSFCPTEHINLAQRWADLSVVKKSLGMSSGGARFIPSVSSTKATELDLMIRVFWREVNRQYASFSNKESRMALIIVQKGSARPLP